LRYWKIVDGKQVVFRGGGRNRMREVLEGGLKGDDEVDDADADGLDPATSKRKLGEGERGFVEGSLDCVAMIDEATFLTGGDSG
jgi:ribosomal RNA-processing protein 9